MRDGRKEESSNSEKQGAKMEEGASKVNQNRINGLKKKRNSPIRYSFESCTY